MKKMVSLTLTDNLVQSAGFNDINDFIKNLSSGRYDWKVY